MLTPHPTRSDAFAVISASLPGREHIRLGRNSQDAVRVGEAGGALVGVVCDGCSSGRHSEVGAQLAADWLVREAAAELADASPVSWEDGLVTLASRLLDVLAALLRAAGRLEDPTGWIQDYLLFTLLVAVVSPRQTLIFGVGDGVFSVNGELKQLAAGEGNAPPYLAYRLLPERGTDDDCRPRCHFAGSTASIESLLIGTDGLMDLERRAAEPLRSGEIQGPVAQFERDPRYLRNPSLVQKRLAVIGDRHRRLPDDTSLVVMRRWCPQRAWGETAAVDLERAGRRAVDHAERRGEQS